MFGWWWDVICTHRPTKGLCDGDGRSFTPLSGRRTRRRCFGSGRTGRSTPSRNRIGGGVQVLVRSPTARAERDHLLSPTTWVAMNCWLLATKLKRGKQSQRGKDFSFHTNLVASSPFLSAASLCSCDARAGCVVSFVSSARKELHFARYSFHEGKAFHAFAKGQNAGT